MNYADSVTYIDMYVQEKNITKLFEFYKKEGVGNKLIAEDCENRIKSLLEMSLIERPAKKSFFTHIKPEKIVTEIITGRGQFMLTKSEEEQSIKRTTALAPFFAIDPHPHSSVDEYINNLLEKAFDENYHVKSIQALKDLTILMRIVDNQSTYAVCLALIVEANNPKIFKEQSKLDKELNYSDSLTALTLLNQLLAEKKIRNYQL